METPTTFAGLVDTILGLIGLLIPLIFGLVFVFVVWKIIDSWILHADDEKKRSEGKMYVVIAVVVFVLMIATWGIVTLLRNTFIG